MDIEEFDMLDDERKLNCEEDIEDFEDFENFYGIDDIDEDGEIKELDF